MDLHTYDEIEKYHDVESSSSKKENRKNHSNSINATNSKVDKYQRSNIIEYNDIYGVSIDSETGGNGSSRDINGNTKQVNTNGTKTRGQK